VMVGRARAGRMILVLGAAIAVLDAYGCFNPKIGPALVCAAPPAKRCPDGFVCATADNLCVAVGTATGGVSGGTGGAGGAGGTCAVPIVPFCQPPGPTTPCDPVCQTGCPCALRCGMTATAVGCMAQAGSKTEGQVCQPTADDCAPGYVCVKETCADIGRCHRFCRAADDCPVSRVCGTPVVLPDGTASGQRACNLGNAACNPFDQTLCPDPSLNCYATDLDSSMCDCPSGKNLAEGDDCVDYNDCIPGLWCLRLVANTSSQCLRLCNTSADCPGCVLQSSSRGYCPL
jgi:hypothetical protein